MFRLPFVGSISRVQCPLIFSRRTAAQRETRRLELPEVYSGEQRVCKQRGWPVRADGIEVVSRHNSDISTARLG